MRFVLAGVLCLVSAVLSAENEKVHDLTNANSGAGFVKRIATVDEFESDVLNNQDVWLVVFTAMSEDEIKLRGVNRENCQKVEDSMIDIAITMNAHGVQVGLADVDDISALASEFNVRKRMLPMAMLFKTRVRDGDAIKDLANTEITALEKTVLEALEENPRGSDGHPQKIMLAVGGGEL